MLIALWIVTGILAAVFIAAGLVKSLTPRTKLVEKMAYMEDLRDWQSRTIGVLELLGGLGLVLPAATGILPWLTPTAAFALVVTMIVATALHVKRKETAAPSIVLAVIALAVGVAWLFFI